MSGNERTDIGYEIHIIEGLPLWDALPSGKIIHYPLAERDYRPFAQVSMCANEDWFYIRLWAFEAHPSPKSVLTAKLNFSPQKSETYLILSSDSKGALESSVQKLDGSVPLALYKSLPQLRTYTGQDLEGEYWGVVISLPRFAVKSVYGEDPIKPGSQITGNVIKQDTGLNTNHIGSLFPADPSHDDPFGPASFKAMRFVADR